jgi:glycerol-3-phosphate dehydrogenase
VYERAGNRTGKRLTEIVSETLPLPVAIWVGPGHVQDFVHGIPNCMVIDSADSALKSELIDAFSGSLIRFYYGTDLVAMRLAPPPKRHRHCGGHAGRTGTFLFKGRADVPRNP